MRGIRLPGGDPRRADSSAPDCHDLAGVYRRGAAAGHATGAGANSRVAIGTGIIGGTLTATLLAVFFVPLFFVLVKRLFTRQRPSQE